jgi:hypothetical protein
MATNARAVFIHRAVLTGQDQGRSGCKSTGRRHTHARGETPKQALASGHSGNYSVCVIGGVAKW